MVRIPDYQAQQGLQVGGGPSLPGVDTTGARALQSVGGAVADLGASLQSSQDKLQDDRDKAWFSKARADASVGWTERKLALKNGATGTDAAGFTDLANKEWSGYRAGVAKGAPSERAKGMFDQWADAFGANDAVDSIDFREKSLFAARGADFESAFEAHKKSVVLDPKQYDRAVALFEDDLEIAKSWMTPEQERAARDKGLAQLQSARLGELVKSDPSGFLASIGGGDGGTVFDRMLRVENQSGDPSAVSGKGAIGVAQVMPGTAREVAQRLGMEQVARLSDAELKAHFAANPDDNVRIGKAYYTEMLDRYHGDVEAAVVAYNGGPQRADGWIAAGKDDRMLPAETADYRKKVLGDGGTSFGGPRSQIMAGTADLGRLSAPARLLLDGIAKAGVVPEIKINSGFRDAGRNAEAGGAKGSQHIHGNALDIDISGLDEKQKGALLQAAIASGARGIGIYPSGNTLHVDTRQTAAIWGGVPGNPYAGHDVNKAPEWARPALTAMMTGAIPAQPSILNDPRLSHLTADQLVAYRDDAASILTKQETAQAAALQAAYNQQFNGLMTGILDGQAGRADVQAARDSGWLTDYDAIKKANDAIDASDKKVVDAGRALGGQKLNQFSTDDKNAADAAVDLLTGQGVDPLVAVDQVYQSSGVVPPKAVQGLRGALAGGSAAAAESAMQVASSILANNANAFAGADGGEDVAKQANAFRHFTELGMQPSQAARRVTEMNTPEYRAKNAVGDKAAADFVKKLTPSDVSSAFELGGSWLGMVGLGQGAAEIGFTYEQRNAVLADFTELAEQRFRETGDEEVAKAYAKQVMSATYGETEFAGRRIFMKFPPSRAYPPVPRADGTPSTDYVAEQAVAAIKESEGTDVAPADVILAPIPNITSRDWSEGKLPRYSVSYWREENGQRVFETVHGQAFSADPKLAEVASVDARAAWDAKAAAAKEKARIEEQALAAGEAAPAISGQPDWMNARGAEIAREGARMNPAPADEASALRDQLPELQRRAISAAITAIRNGASPDAITKRLRDAGVPASLWPDEVK